jgi:hypothetical protein
LEKTLGNSAFGYSGVMEVWDYKHFTSLKLMCKVLGFLRQRDIDGSQVGHVFYVDKDIDRLLLIVKRTPLPLLKFFFDCEEVIDRRRNYPCLNKIWAVKF